MWWEEVNDAYIQERKRMAAAARLHQEARLEVEATRQTVGAARQTVANVVRLFKALSELCRARRRL